MVIILLVCLPEPRKMVNDAVGVVWTGFDALLFASTSAWRCTFLKQHGGIALADVFDVSNQSDNIAPERWLLTEAFEPMEGDAHRKHAVLLAERTGSAESCSVFFFGTRLQPPKLLTESSDQ